MMKCRCPDHDARFLRDDESGVRHRFVICCSQRLKLLTLLTW